MSVSENLSTTAQSKGNTVSVNLFSEFSIGSLLLRMGKISAEDAERIIQLHKDKGLRFGEAAISLGLVTETDIQQVLSRQFDYPYLHELGSFPTELVAAYKPFSPKAEVLRAVRSRLMLHWFSSGRKALAFAGINSGDGTSHFVANLAVVFAQLGENTLLIDANLRNPRQQKIYNLTEKRGLSDILAGRADEEVITPIAGFEGLSVLSAGTLPPNPQELVSKANFKSLIAQLTLQYDIVLIDAPAFEVGADVQTIAATVGGAVIVTRSDKTRMQDVEVAGEMLAQSGAQIVGSILVDI